MGTDGMNFRGLLGKIPDVILSFDVTGRCKYANSAVLGEFGMKPAEMIGKTCADWGLDVLLAAELGSAIRQIIESGQETICEFPARLAAGLHFYEACGVPETGPDGKLVSVIFSLRNVTRRTQVDLKRQASQMRLELMLEHLPLAAIEWDTDFKVTAWNPAAEQIFGYSKADAMGCHASLLVPAESRPHVNRIFSDLLMQQGGNSFVNENFTADRRRITCEWFNTPLVGSDGRVIGVSSLVQDITARIKAEDTLHATSETMQAILAVSPLAIILMDMDGIIQFWNPASERIFGWTASEVIGQPNPIVPADLVDEYRVLVDRVFTEGRLENIEVVRQCKDGSRINIELCSALLHDSDGRPRARMAIMADITERKRIEAALRKSEERYRSIFENAVEGMFQSLPTGRYMTVNPAMARMFGYDSPVDMVTCITDISAQIYVDASQREMFKNGLEEHDVITNFETQNYRKDGGVIWVSSNARSVRDVEGNLLYYEGTITDITERRNAASEIQRLNTDLERRVIERTFELEIANKELESFSYSVSHDLRAPLRSIDGYSRILIEDYNEILDVDGRQYLENIRSAVRRMNMLIDDLLRLSQVKKADFRRDVAPLSEYARDILFAFQQREPNRQIDVRIQPGLRVKADPSLMKILLENLLGNAWKFTGRKEKALIEFGALEQEGGKAYFVRDNGAGFDIQRAASLFNVFQRFHRQDEFEGTGVGLTTVQRIIERHGGRVWAEASEGQGATFYFTIPEG